jgi:tetratricopeptide (TPR) repeat protein
MPVVIAALFLALAAPDVNGEARERFKSAQLHYSLGEFEDAVKDFREAYRLRQEPAILFNIAQAYRQLGKHADAYFYYRQYLSQKTDAPNRPEVESLIEQMRRRVDEENEQKMRTERDPAAVHNPESTMAAPHAEATPPPPPTKSTGLSNLRIAGYVALGAGALAEGAALLFRSSAQSSADQFNRQYAAGQLTSADARLKSDADSKGKLATAALIGGVLFLVTGAVLSFAF